MLDYIKKTLSVLATQLLTLPLTLLAGILIARYLGPEGKGALAIMVLVATILKLISGLGIEFSNVFFLGKDKKLLNQIVTNNIIIWLLAAVSCVTIVFVAQEYVLKYLLPGFNRTLFYIALFIFPAFLWLSFSRAIFQGLESFKIYNFLKVSEPITKVIAVIVLVVLLRFGLRGGAIAMLLSYLLPAVLSVLILTKYAQPGFPINTRLCNRSIKYGLKGQIGIFFQFFNYRIDMFLVLFYLGAKSVGIYVVSVAIAELLWHIPNSVSTTLFPRISAQDKDSANEFTCRVSRGSIAVMLVVAVVLAIVSIVLIPAIYGRRFSASVTPLHILLPGVIFFGLVKILTSYMHGRGKPQYGSIVTVCSLFLTLTFDFLLIPSMKVQGAALATTIAYASSFVITLFMFVRMSKLKLTDFLVPDFLVVPRSILGILREKKQH
jgi:O-antigen/teichoic acid export membrane protein